MKIHYEKLFNNCYQVRLLNDLYEWKAMGKVNRIGPSEWIHSLSARIYKTRKLAAEALMK